MDSSVQYFTVRFINNNTNPDVTADNIYVTCKGQLSDSTGQEFFLQFDGTTGNGGFVQPTTTTMEYKNYAYALSHFPLLTGSTDTYLINIPRGQSFRIFISIGQKLFFMLINGDNGQVTINEPPTLNASYNADVLSDKFEMTFLNTDKAAFVNTTAVDGVCLPFKLQEPDGDKTTPLGFIHSRETTMTNILSGLNTGDWSKLFYKTTDAKSVIRLLSQPQANQGDNIFPTDYLDEYIHFVWWWFAQTGNSIGMDCTEVSGSVAGPTSWTFSSDPAKSHFDSTTPSKSYVTWSNGESVYDEKVYLPTSGNVWGVDGTLDTPDKTLRAVINKNLGACLNRGIMPSTVAGPINLAWYSKVGVADAFYKNNALFTNSQVNTYNHSSIESNKSYFNLYSSVLHQSTITTGGLYAFSYDDVGGQDSTLSGENATYVNLTLMDLVNTTIPSTGGNQSTFDILFAPASGATPACTGYYYTTDPDTKVETKVKMDGATVAKGMPNAFKISYGVVGGTLKDYNININERDWGGLGIDYAPDFPYTNPPTGTVARLGIGAVTE